ncbi:MAG: ABC transporter permease [Deltaproteobacteria bacterium]|nr:ABC transporter permease [Deltaproteobacteria bacterium]
MGTGVITILQKEWRQYFLSPIAYVILVVFLALAGFFYYDLFTYFVQTQTMYQAYQNPEMAAQVNVNDMILTPLFHNLSVLLLLIIPLVTMRLYAEERKNGTEELLLTSPIRESSIVYGKFLGAVSFYLAALLLTAQFPLLLYKYGSPDLGKLLTGYLGLFLMGTSFLAFGLFSSTLARTQIQAAMWSFFTLLLLWIVGWVSESLPGASGEILRYIAMLPHFEGFADGTLKLSDLVYYASFISLFLFLSTRVVESARWR